MGREASFDEFWLGYLRAHSRRLTRLIHYLGITTIFAGVLAAILSGQWWFGLAGLIAGYLIAFSAHYTVQHNRPVLFEGPRAAFWSIGCALHVCAWRDGPARTRVGPGGYRGLTGFTLCGTGIATWPGSSLHMILRGCGIFLNSCVSRINFAVRVLIPRPLKGRPCRSCKSKEPPRWPIAARSFQT